MTRLAVALGIRRRELDKVRLAIASRQQLLASFASASADLRRTREAERRTAALAPVSSDAWFGLAAARLADLASGTKAVEAELAGLRRTAVDAQARLSLLEQAEEEARKAERRRRDQRAQIALDDSTAARWRRP